MQLDSKDNNYVYSMTGFGEGEAFAEGIAIKTEVRTVNHSDLSVRIRGLKDKKLLQHKTESYVKDLFSRGRIEIQVSSDQSGGVDLARLDTETLAESYDALLELSEALGMEEKPTFSDLISLGLFQQDLVMVEAWPVLKKSIAEAAEEVVKTQRNEGEDVRSDLLNYVQEMKEGVDKIQDRVPVIVSEHKERLQSRVEELMEEPGDLDPKRLEQEFATIADKLDVNEELSRIRTHLRSAEETLSNGGTVGKKLKFIGQELQREINTLGAKTKDGAVQTDVIELKLSLEKFKEQARNLA